MPRRVAVIDDDTNIRDLLHDVLADEGDEALCLSGSEGLENLCAFNPDIIVLDLRLDHPDGGRQLLAGIRCDTILSGKPVIICSADRGQMQDSTDDFHRQGCLMLDKPFDLDTFLHLIDQAMRRLR